MFILKLLEQKDLLGYIYSLHRFKLLTLLFTLHYIPKSVLCLYSLHSLNQTLMTFNSKPPMFQPDWEVDVGTMTHVRTKAKLLTHSEVKVPRGEDLEVLVAGWGPCT